MVNIQCRPPQTYATLQSPCHNDRCVPVLVSCIERHESTEILQILFISITLGRQTANGQAVLFHHANITQLLQPLIKICRHVSKYGHDTWSTWHAPVCARTNTHANSVSNKVTNVWVNVSSVGNYMAEASVRAQIFYTSCSVVVEHGRFDHIITSNPARGHHS